MVCMAVFQIGRLSGIVMVDWGEESIMKQSPSDAGRLPAYKTDTLPTLSHFDDQGKLFVVKTFYLSVMLAIG